MSATTTPRVIILWVHPRSTSTMFERMFLNRSDVFHVQHEPMGDAWYQGCERASPRYSAERLAKEFPQHRDLTFAECWKRTIYPEATTGSDGKKLSRVFIKDMAQYLVPPRITAKTAPSVTPGNPFYVPLDDLLADDIVHTFLIRSPTMAVPSYYRLCSGDRSAVTGFDYFDPDEIGLKELRTLYELIAARKGAPPMLIDSSDLLNRPEPIMRAYCKHVDVDFTPSMLEWESGTIPHFDKWRGFHDDAERSTGITTPPRKSKTHSQKPSVDLPDEVVKAIADNMADYEWLHARRLQI